MIMLFLKNNAFVFLLISMVIQHLSILMEILLTLAKPNRLVIRKKRHLCRIPSTANPSLWLKKAVCPVLNSVRKLI